MKKRMLVLLSLTLVCLMLLVGCGKKQTVTGSGSGETDVPEQTETTKKNDKKTKAKAKESPSPAPSAAATAAPTVDPVQAVTEVQSGEEGTWEDVEQAQEDVMENLAVSPTGNWSDRNSSATMVVDGDGSATILWIQSDGSAYFWTFTLTQDDDGTLHYSDCVKQIQSGNQPPRVLYQNGTGTLTIKDGSMYWQDDIEDSGSGCVFAKES